MLIIKTDAKPWEFLIWQSLLRAHPDTLLSVAAEQAGFAGTTSFFRNFKAVTGLTPAEWLAEDSGSCPQ